MVAFNFDARQVEPSLGGFPVIPAGRYNVMITATSPKPTKDSTPENPASYLEIDLTIMDGPHKGVAVKDRLNLQNQNQQAMEIAYKSLSAYCHVVGKYMITDTSQLHNIPFQADISEEERNDQQDRPKEQRGKNNRVARVFDANGNPPQKAGQGPAQPAPAAAATQQPTQWGGTAQPEKTAASPWPSQPAGAGQQPGPTPPWNR